MKRMMLYSLLSLPFLMLGCKKSFLDVQPSNIISLQQYVSDLSTLQNYLNGTFGDMAQYIFDSHGMIYADVVADNVKPNGTTDLSAQYKWKQIAGSETDIGTFNIASKPNMNGLWIACYRVARRASYVLENIDRFRSANPAKADTIKGQALVLRTIAHFQLLNVFSQPFIFSTSGNHPGIPYVTTSAIDEKVTRSTVAANYEALITDLTTAIPLLPDQFQRPNILLFSKNAGMALLARIYLFKNDWNNAKEQALKVANSIPLMKISEGYPDNLFKPSNLQTESLFQIPPEQTAFEVLNANFNYRLTMDMEATMDIASLLQNNSTDVRRKWVTSSGTSRNVTKFPTRVVSGARYPELSYYFPLIRATECYLTLAECYARLNDATNTIKYLDAVRLRANPDALPTPIDTPGLLDSVALERRKEFCFEGLRMYDLQRTGNGVTRIDGPADAKTLPFPSNKAIAPLPIGEVLLSQLSQNTDY